MTRPRPSPRPRSSRHERSPPRTAPGPRATPPSELPETGSAPDTTAPPAAAPASLPPPHTSTVEVLRRPVEFTVRSVIGVGDRPARRRLTTPQGHLQDVDDKLGAHVI